jgi:putative transposase
MIYKMKDSYPRASLARFCWLFGITRQAYYQHFMRAETTSIEEEFIIKEVLRVRENHRRMGGRKLYELLEPFMLEHGIKMGRDALFDLLSAHNLLIRHKRRRIYTTNSFHRFHKYPNLIRGMALTLPNQLWVSDITYFKAKSDDLYISLVTDAYSHKIVGYHIADTMQAIESQKALAMALKGMNSASSQLIHHSDRGSQYCCAAYVKMLQEKGVAISMTESGDPLENPVAERVNGIIKQEYMDFYAVKNLAEAERYLENAVSLYNTERPHLSLGMLKPENVHKNSLKVENLWKKNKKVIPAQQAASPVDWGAAAGQNNFSPNEQITNIVNQYQD